MRLNTQAAEEFRFWLTRRLTLRLLPALEQALGRLESSQPGMMAHDPAAQQILTDLKRDAFLQQADFKTPYAEKPQQLPLGDEPMLVTDVQLNLQGKGVQITLQDKGGTPGQSLSCQLHLPPQLLHGLVHLIRQAMDRAQWGGVQGTQAPAPAPSMEPSAGYRH